MTGLGKIAQSTTHIERNFMLTSEEDMLCYFAGQALALVEPCNLSSYEFRLKTAKAAFAMAEVMMEERELQLENKYGRN